MNKQTKTPKVIQFLELFKPTFMYLFLLYVSGLLAMGWILYTNNSFDTVQLLYLFLTLFFFGYVFLGYMVITKASINLLTIIGQLCLMAIPVVEQRALFFKLSYFLFGIGLGMKIFEIVSGVDLDYQLKYQLNRMFNKK